MYTHILIPTDGSERSMKAAHHGIALAKVHGAKILVVHTSPSFHMSAIEPLVESMMRKQQFVSKEERLASQCLEPVRKAAEAAGVPCQTKHVVEDHPYKGILSAAQDNKCDLIVIGSHGRGNLTATLLGSQTTKVLSHSTIPVLVLR